MKSKQLEIAALFAAWKDDLVAACSATDNANITEVREHWQESKKRFEAERFQVALDWMRAQAIVPATP